MFNNHLMKACLAAVFAIGLAACSSSSDNGSAGTTDPDPGPTQEEQQLADLQQEIADLRAQLGIADDADIGDSITALMAERDRLQKQIDDAADDDAEAMRKAMAATAAKLHAGISAPVGDGTGVSDRHAAYSGTNDSQVSVTFGDGTTAGTAIVLSEDEDTMVAANYGWSGKRYVDDPDGDVVEAVVYSNVADPTPGRKFGSAEPGSGDNRGYEYLLVGGELTEANAGGVGSTGITDFIPARVGFEGVARTAGTETWHLPDPNNLGQTEIRIPGSYHGVSGDYYCTPGTAANGCSADVAAIGFTVADGDTWTFTPDSASARVMDAPDTAYASYGWWLHKTENDKTFTASAFVDRKGADPDAVDIANLVAGTATYMGGAAGKYALSSTTGGTNDAGHFTARVTLEADFADDKISGTIDNFMGADGQSRNWEVDLMDSTISNVGLIAGDPDTTGNTDAQMTKWTIGDAAADAAGSWSGQLWEEDDDGVPEVVTGTFYSEYGTAGKMVGAYGANEQ